MKIKKIEWKNDGSGLIYNAMLTTGQDAEVVAVCQSTEYYDEQWSWEIDTESRGGACGVAKSKELAMEACQAAWEKMVIEAIDVDECYGGGMTKDEFLEALRELEIPVEGGSVHNGKETYVLGNDKCVKVEFEICDEDSVYNFVTLSSTRGSLRLTVNMWLKELEFADWGNMEGFIVNNNSTDDGATVSLGYDV